MILRRVLPPGGVFLLLFGLLALGGTLFAVRGLFGEGSRKPNRNGLSLGSDVSRAAPVDSDVRTGFIVDGRRQQLIGVRTAHVANASLARKIRAVGIVQHDETRLTDFNLKLEGWIRDLHVGYVGQRVKLGQPLFTVYSPELEALQLNLIAALKTREQTSAAQAADSPEYADRRVDPVRRRLKQWDVAEEELRALETSLQLPAATLFRSPTDGVVIEAAVQRGMHFESGQTLYRIADLSVVLVEASFREADVDLLAKGARADVTLDAFPGLRFIGRLLSTYPYVSEKTRTLKARIELRNHEGRLRPGMFANVELTASARNGLVVPADAVVDSGSRQIVFVAQGNGYFEPRAIKVGERIDGQVLILDGLSENEEIATRATFFLDSESQMRAALENYEAMPSLAAPAPATNGLEFSLQFTPDPPRPGGNILQVRVSETNGNPVIDANIDVRLSMPPMPTMNMPAMRADARLVHVSGGLYRGTASIPMSGRWDLTITARRGDRLVGSKHTTLLVR